VGQVGEGGARLGSSWFGVAFVVLGLATNAAAVGRYARIRKALEKGDSFAPSPTLAYSLGVGSVIVAVAMAIMLAASLKD
jgi:uncharacterized membrane protein YidH (DUF202 family)